MTLVRDGLPFIFWLPNVKLWLISEQKKYISQLRDIIFLIWKIILIRINLVNYNIKMNKKRDKKGKTKATSLESDEDSYLEFAEQLKDYFY